MTRRKILNITTKKKRDTMQAVSYNGDNGAPTNDARPGVGMVFQGGRTNMILWSPTARDLTDSNAIANSSVFESGRTSSTVYQRLLSEKIRLTTSDSIPWMWRRIVVSTKAPEWRRLVTAEATSGKNAAPYIETSNGVGRLLQQWDQYAGSAASQTIVLGDLFRGQQGKDWTDPMTAPIDTLSMNKHYDKTTVIRSGNDSGTLKITRRTHTINRTMRYDEDESGQFQDSSYWSAPGKGMGDVFIVDFFSNLIGTSTSLLRFDTTATMYWHER